MCEIMFPSINNGGEANDAKAMGICCCPQTESKAILNLSSK